jgi:P27 family predicted phage terminase small subunit
MGIAGKGRPRKPTSLAVVDGTKPSRINDREPIPDQVPAEPPTWLSSKALEYWNRLAPQLEAKGVLTSWDVQSFAEWCDAAATIELASAAIDEQGHLVEQDVFDRNGKPTGTRVVTNPWEFIKRSALEVTKSRAARFGLTPAERASLMGPGGGAVDDADRYLA